MLGKLLSGIVKVVTLPVTVLESVGDVMLGQEIIDGICKAVESIDD